VSRSQTTLAEGRRALSRVAHAWGVLGREQRWAALASIGLFVSMLLPWYSKTVVESARAGQSKLPTSQASLSAFQAFSFVEAAVLLVSAGVLAMLFARAEGRDFHLPGGDGTIVTIAGGWAALLIFYRLLDKPSLQGTQRITATVGVEWGIFIALLVALAMVYVGRRIHAGERGQPPLARTRDRARSSTDGPSDDADGAETVVRPRHDDDDRPRSPQAGEGERRTLATTPVAARPRPAPRADSPPAGASESSAPRARPRFPPAPSGPSRQMSFEDSPGDED
jgi:hypothetical protein